MLEHPSISQYFGPNQSDNLRSADNQQERLVRIGWILGFVDGEGCFSIGFVRQGGGTDRRGYKTGYQVSHEFAVTQGARSILCLHDLREFFGVGQVLVNRRTDNHTEQLYRYVVRRRTDLLETVIPFFKQYPLRSSKRQDFSKFAQVVSMIANKQHLTREGLIEIAQIAETMNRKKSRTELIGILRDYTPDARDIG
jgi:LAGLIDADG endonuclease